MRWARWTTIGLGVAEMALALPTPPGLPDPGSGRPHVFIAPSGKPYRPTDAQPDGRRAWFIATDLNHDGLIDQGEFRAEFDRFFGEIDLDHNGEIDPMEVEHYEQVIAPEVQTAGSGAEFGERPRRAGRRGRAGGGQRMSVAPQSEGGPPSGEGATAIPYLDAAMGASRFGLLDIPEPVASCDIDMNRSISRAEFRSAADRRFKALDANGDGKLGWDELPRRSPPTLRRGPRR